MDLNVAGNEGAAEARSALDEIVLKGAQRMLAAVLEQEVEAFIAEHGSIRDDSGNRQIVRNGYLPERKILTGAGEFAVNQP